MIRCPTCSYENVAASTYCEHCGSVLNPAAAPTVPTYAVPSEPPPPPPESLLSRRQLQQRTRTVGGITLSILLYLWAIFWASFGLAGSISSLVSSEGMTLTFIVACAVGLLLLIPLLRLRKRFSLGPWKRLFLEIGLILLGFLALVVVSAVLPTATQGQNQNYFYGSLLVVYGLIAAIFSFW